MIHFHQHLYRLVEGLGKDARHKLCFFHLYLTLQEMLSKQT